MPEIIINKEKCKGCGLCIYYCPQKSLKISSAVNKKGYAYVEVCDAASCKSCSMCVLVCPDSCIIVEKQKMKIV